MLKVLKTGRRYLQVLQYNVAILVQGWEFMKENKKVRKQEDKNSTKKKKLLKKSCSQPRIHPRKKVFYLLDCFLGCILFFRDAILDDIVFS